MTKHSLVCRLSQTAAGIFIAAALCVGPAQAQNQAPDNTRNNRTDTKTENADRADNKKSDVKMSAAIRRDIVHDKSLSAYGHNVKVVASHGKVTLKGPVHSDDEKRTIEQYAEKHAGAGNVDNQLEVKSDQK